MLDAGSKDRDGAPRDGLEMILEVFLGRGNIFCPMDSNNRDALADKSFLAIWQSGNLTGTRGGQAAIDRDMGAGIHGAIIVG